jgi:hypothetical protein
VPVAVFAYRELENHVGQDPEYDEFEELLKAVHSARGELLDGLSTLAPEA